MNITLETVNRILSKGFVHNASNDAIIADLNAMNTTEADVAEYAASKAFTEHGEGFHALRDLKRYMKQKRGGAPAKARAPRAPKAPKTKKVEPKKDAPKDAPKEEPAMGAAEHERFRRCMNVVNVAEMPLLMVGPAGSGKSYMAAKVAEACGCTKMYTRSKVAFDTDLIGYMDAHSHYCPTALYRAMKRADGGEKTAYFLDEIFAGDTSCLIVINDLLSDGCMTFPNGEEFSAENLVIIAADNTSGCGATNQFNTRNKADASFLNRFGSVFVDYDKEIEKKLAGEHKDILEFVYAVRAAAEKNEIDIVCSYRTIKCMRKYAEAGIPAVEAVEEFVYQNKLTEDDKDTLRQDAKITRLISKGNQYALAM